MFPREYTAGITLSRKCLFTYHLISGSAQALYQGFISPLGKKPAPLLGILDTLGTQTVHIIT